MHDALVWDGTTNYCNNSDLTAKRNDFLYRFNWRVNWLYSQWGEGIEPEVEGLPVTGYGLRVEKVLRDGQLYIIRGGQMYTIQGQIVK